MVDADRIKDLLSSLKELNKFAKDEFGINVLEQLSDMSKEDIELKKGKRLIELTKTDDCLLIVADQVEEGSKFEVRRINDLLLVSVGANSQNFRVDDIDIFDFDKSETRLKNKVLSILIPRKGVDLKDDVIMSEESG